MSTSDPFNLRRFVDAQASTYDQAIRELKAGRKASHWMWFVFPQIAGLGSSAMAQRYAIGGCEEALAYLRHELLGPRLEECTALVNAVEGRSAHDIFGTTDDLKFRSCMTLFGACDPEKQIFSEALRKYFGSEGDPLTLRRLGDV